jgi:phenylacetate-CoA ligase
MSSVLGLLFEGLRQKSVLWRSPERIRSLQRKRLRRLVAHARRFSPFYADLYRGIDPDAFDLRELPAIGKKVMMENFDRFLTQRSILRRDVEEFMSDPERLGQWYQGQYACSHTSGTGGMQAVIVQDRSMLELLFALQMLRGSPLARTPGGFFQRLFRKTRLAVVTIGKGFYPSASALAYAPEASKAFIERMWLSDIDRVEEVVARFNAFQPEIILAYSSVLEILAREALAGRLQLGRRSTLAQLMNMSEPLSQGARTLVEQAFGLPVTDNYAMGECMALTTGCLRGQGMHLQADWAILEVVDRQNRPVADGEPGEKVLMTNLYNTLQPFIRYEVNDVVTIGAEPCPCGSPLPWIKSVEGRTDEVVWIQENGKFRTVHPYVFLDMLDEFPAVGWYQIEQVERNRFELRAAAAPGRKVEAGELKRVMMEGLRRHGLGDLIEMDVIVDGAIAPDPRTGKLKRISSRVGRPKEVAG